MPEKDYKEYVKFMETKADDIRNKSQERRNVISMRIWSLEKERRDYIKKFKYIFSMIIIN